MEITETTLLEDREGPVAAAVEMAHALDMKIVAEGVETDKQLQVLDDLGCDLAQGYLFPAPMPVDEMTNLLDTAAAGGTLGGPITPGI